MTPSTTTPSRPEGTTTRGISTKALVIAGLLVSLVLAGIVSAYASGHPDGLEYVAEQVGFIETAEDSAAADSPMADYATQGVESERLSVGIAGVLGVAITAAVMWGLLLLLRRHPGDSPGQD